MQEACGDAVQLSDEELIDNWQQRVDEIVALDSIYGEDFRILGLHEGDTTDLTAEALADMPAPSHPTHIFCSMSIHVEVPDTGIQVYLDMPSSTSTSTSTGTGTGTGTDISTSTGTRSGTSNGTRSGTSTGTRSGTGAGTSTSTSTSTSTDTRSGTGAGTSTSTGTRSGTSNGIGTSADTSTSDVLTTSVPVGGRVNFLTPVQLKLKLPPQYPSQRMPFFKFACSWMSQQQVKRVVEQLEEMWDVEGRGMPFCYAWIDWIQSQVLQFLGVVDRLLLGADLHSKTHGVKSGQSSCSHTAMDHMHQRIQHMQDVALSIVRYNGMREQAKFDQGSWLCCICFEYNLGAKCVRLPDCGHFFCEECISQHCKIKVKDGNVDDIWCPIPDCRLQVSPYVLRKLLSEEEFERWEELLLNRTLDRMHDVVYCPRCNTSCVEDKDHCAQCPRCYFAFCSLCHTAWHPGEQCVDPSTRLRIMEERSKGNRRDAEKLAAQQQDLMNQMQSLKLVRESSRNCPSCQMAIQKSEGCNKMVCTYCSTKFCYQCLRKIDGYDHFGATACELFPQEEINRWNARMNAWQPAAERQDQMVQGRAQVEAARILGERFVNRLANCPVCGQANLKMNNNNAMRCWACGCAFCYQCRSYIRAKVSLHFKPKGQCSQHSAD